MKALKKEEEEAFLVCFGFDKTIVKLYFLFVQCEKKVTFLPEAKPVLFIY